MEESYERFYNVIIHNHEIYLNNIRYEHSLRPNEYEKTKTLGYLPNFLNIKNINCGDNSYLFLFDKDKACGGNYFHFCFHFMQKLHGYFKIKNYISDMKVIVRSDINEFQKELLLKFIDEQNVIYLDVVNNWYNIKSCFIGKFLDICTISKFLVDKYQDLSNELFDYSKCNFINKVFIERNTYNSAGSDRTIVNKNQYYTFLNNNKILITSFDNKKIKKKIFDLMTLMPKVIIIETGSGLVNLLFIPKQILKKIKIILLNPILWNIKESRIYKIFEVLQIKPNIINCKSIINTSNLDKINNPYVINLDSLKEELN